MAYHVECDRTYEGLQVLDSEQGQPFLYWNFNEPISEFATRTLGKKGSASTIFDDAVGISLVSDGTSSTYFWGTNYADRLNNDRWNIMKFNLKSEDVPLVGVLILAFDNVKSAHGAYKFPKSENLEFDPALGEHKWEFGAGDNLACPATTTGDFRPMVILYAGTALKYCDDLFADVKTKKSVAIPALQDLGLVVDHVLAHELAHVFGIDEAFDDSHRYADGFCVMNNAVANSDRYNAKVNNIITGNNDSINAFDMWIRSAVFATTLGDFHQRGCDYDEIVGYYESVNQ